MKKKNILNGVFHYFIALFFSVICLLYMNSTVGWYLFLALMIAPLLSVFFAWIFSKKIKLTYELAELLLEKGDSCSMKIGIFNATILPTSPIIIDFIEEPRFQFQGQKYVVSVFSRSHKNIEIPITARIAGKACVGIKEIRVRDYFGFVSFPVKNIDYSFCNSRMGILPKIAEISAKEEEIVKALHSSATSEDSADTIENSLQTFGGFPGYNSRIYVPADPLKRINWKQSAKKNSLLIRLDDEMSSQAISVILDSTFLTSKFDVSQCAYLNDYRDCKQGEVIPKIEENAIENALGIINIFLKQNFTLHFYVMQNDLFVCYEISNESDLELVRNQLGRYSFAENNASERFPENLLSEANESVFIFSTPHADEDICMQLEAFAQKNGNNSANIFSAIEYSKKDSNNFSTEEPLVINETAKKENSNLQEKLIHIFVPGLMAVILCIILLSVYDIPFFSVWTVVAVGICGFVCAVCEYLSNSKYLGKLVIIVLIFATLYTSFYLIMRRFFDFHNWFLSGGNEGNGNASYILALLLMFSVFFSLSLYYFTRKLYRISFLVAISLIPFVLYAKVLEEPLTIYVVLVAIAILITLIIHRWRFAEKQTKIISKLPYVTSIGMFFVFLFLMIYFIPKQEEPPYYSKFEYAFLGGSEKVELPDSYSQLSETSGNADNFNRINNRKLYTLQFSKNITTYLKRQNFDYYDFENDNWYSDTSYSEAVLNSTEWFNKASERMVSRLAQAIQVAALYSPEFIEKYHLEKVASNGLEENLFTCEITAENFPSISYLVPTRSLLVETTNDVMITQHGTFKSNDLQDENISYTINGSEDFNQSSIWFVSGIANFDNETSKEMLIELKSILSEKHESSHSQTADAFLQMLTEAQQYSDSCAENTANISDEIKELARSITADCKYDWQKAEALESYFSQNGFVYDVEYIARDTSPEYFLFKSKRGSCSDYASAYVLMARAVGLTVRYAEGFVPQTTEIYNQKVINSNCAHAYPEVYIQNIGYIVYEPTVPDYSPNNFILGYFSRIWSRVVQYIFYAGWILGIILVLVFTLKVIKPLLSEMIFSYKLRKSEASVSILMIYKRISNILSKKLIPDANILTPYELAKHYEVLTGEDISKLIYLLEDVSYRELNLTKNDQLTAETIYKNMLSSIRAYKRKH